VDLISFCLRQDSRSYSLPGVPTVFIKNGFRFFFYSNEHAPIHIHVRKGSGEAVFELENGIVLRESAGLKTAELREAEDLAGENQQLIIRKWHEHIG
jgi:hypothetical protein